MEKASEVVSEKLSNIIRLLQDDLKDNKNGVDSEKACELLAEATVKINSILNENEQRIHA